MPDPANPANPDNQGHGPPPYTGANAGASANGPVPPRRRSRGRRAVVVACSAVAALLLGGLGYAATGAELPLIGSKSGGKQAHETDVPAQYIGTWSGAVERDGEPTGQYRRFVISKGEVGEVIANSVSLGARYACESDGKLSAKPTASAGLRLDTKVVKSVPEDKCSALGEHTLTSEGGDALRWRANGRTATLHKVSGPEKLPAGMTGEWQRLLPDGGKQRLTVTEDALEEGRGLKLVSEGAEHCEATVDVFSAGREGGGGDVRVAPPAVKRERSRGACAAGGSSTLKLEGTALVRTFPDGSALRYTRIS